MLLLLLSNDPGLMDFAVELIDSALHLPDCGTWKFLEQYCKRWNFGGLKENEFWASAS